MKLTDMKITLKTICPKRPQIGDRRRTKRHGLQIRVVQTSQGMWCRSNGRYVYEWRSPETLIQSQWFYLLNEQERQVVLAGGKL